MPVGRENIPIQYSQFNDAAKELARIDELYKRIHQYRRTGNLSSWNFELDAIWTELSGDKNVSTADEDKFYSFMKDYVQSKKNRSSLYQVLIRKEVFLRKLQNRLGKGSKYSRPDDTGMN